MASGDTAFSNRAFGFWVYLMTDLVLFASLFAIPDRAPRRGRYGTDHGQSPLPHDAMNRVPGEPFVRQVISQSWNHPLTFSPTQAGETHGPGQSLFRTRRSSHGRKPMEKRDPSFRPRTCWISAQGTIVSEIEIIPMNAIDEADERVLKRT